MSITTWLNHTQCRWMDDNKNYKAMSSTIIPLVPSSFALRFISIMLSLCLRYTSVMPSLCLRFVNGGRSSSQRRMIEFTTKDERRTNEGTTEKEILYQQQTLWRYKATTNIVANVNIGIGINKKSIFLDNYRCLESMQYDTMSIYNHDTNVRNVI